MSSTFRCRVQTGFIILLGLTVCHLAVWRLGDVPLSNRSEGFRWSLTRDDGVNEIIKNTTGTQNISHAAVLQRSLRLATSSQPFEASLKNSTRSPVNTSKSSQSLVTSTSRATEVTSPPSNRSLLRSPIMPPVYPFNATLVMYTISAPPESEEIIYQLMRSSANFSTTYLAKLAHSDYHRKTYDLIWSANPCVGTRTELLIMVATAPWHLEQRDAIRATWGRSDHIGNSSKLVFLIGQSKYGKKQPLLEPALTQEFQRYGDLIRYDFLEDYLNLTIKSVLMLRWASTYCPDARYLLKVDGDMWVNVLGIKGLLANTPQNLTITGYGFGYPSGSLSPHRHTTSKWHVPEAMYPGTHWPPFVSGTTYVVTMALVPKLLESSQTQGNFVYLEDIFLLGLSAEQVKGVTMVNTNGFCIHNLIREPDKMCTSLTSHGYTAKQLHKIASLCQDKVAVELLVCEAVVSSRIVPSTSPAATDSRWNENISQCQGVIARKRGRGKVNKTSMGSKH